MVDLVISETDLSVLTAALRSALADLETLRHVMNGLDIGSVGAAALVDAGTRFSTARGQDLSSFGRGFAELSDMATSVEHVMTAADRLLGDRARPAR